jgi:ABC-type transport system, involved in lipoprotein release, permease component
MVAMCGIAVATIAMVCTLSVFNGFQSMVSTMFSEFDPELKVTPIQGKVFEPNTIEFEKVRNLPEVELMLGTLEDHVLISNDGKQAPATLKGVPDNYDQLTHIANLVSYGEYLLNDPIADYALAGIGLASNLGIYAQQLSPLELYVPKRNTQINLANPSNSFVIKPLLVSGIFTVNQAVYDENYLIVPISLVRELFSYPTEVSALEIKLKEDVSLKSAQKKIAQIIGTDYEVKDRYQQQEAAFRMMNIEKWVSFLVLCFILLIAAFNIIGSISMLIVDKQKDIKTLQNLGADNKDISNIFLFEGWLISFFGVIIGLFLGVLICLGQQHFGWLKLGNSGTFLVNAYPVQIEIWDLALVLIAVSLISALAVLYPVRYLSRKKLKLS